MSTPIVIPSLRVEGSHYEVGLQIGKHFAENIKKFCKEFEVLHQELLPFYNSEYGKKFVDELERSNKTYYPQYFEELQGMVDGCGVSYEWILLLHLRREIGGILDVQKGRKPATAGELETNCSTIHVKNSERTLIAHNEDHAPEMLETAFLVTVSTPGNPTFVAYQYPGILPGMAWGFNEHVIIMCNSTPLSEAKNGLARAFVNRDLLAATSLRDAIARATPPGRASGFSVNLGDVKNQVTINVEVATSSYAVVENQDTLYHWNIYQYLRAPQYYEPSSVDRRSRAKELPLATNEDGIITLLSDTQNDYPIFRTATPPDHAATLAVVLIDLTERHLTLWAGNPKKVPPQFNKIKMNSLLTIQ